MRKLGNLLIGDYARIHSYTVRWHTITLHPSTYYRRLGDFQKTLDSLDGMWVELDMGDCVQLRLSDKADVTKFYKTHHKHI